MAARGYALIDVPIYRRLWPDLDAVVAVMEHIRRNLQWLEPGIPPECEADLIAGETSHSDGPIPLLGLYLPPHVPARRWPDLQHLEAIIAEWCEARSDEKLKAFAWASESPTWQELLSMRIHPAREGHP